MNETKKSGVYQNVLLFLMAVMVLVFTVLFFINVSKEWYEYKDTLLIYSKEGDNTVFSGEVEGEKTVITMTANKTIEIKSGEKVLGPYVLKADESAAFKEGYFGDTLIGVVVYCGDEIRFRGGILKFDGRWLLYKEDGTGGVHDMTEVMDDGTRIDAQGNIVDPMEPSVSELLALWEGPELIKKVSWEPWFFGVIICIINTISIIFADDLFKWSLHFVIRNADEAEPSGWEIVSRYISWTVMFILAFVLFFVGIL